jgi:two-component system, cell cycle sensor histidine kinase and response regulator CckA
MNGKKPSYKGMFEDDVPVSTGIITGTETILVVDDEIMVRELAEIILAEAGYKPIPACSGTEAVSIYTERGKEIDLVILDMIMPEMDGAAVYHALKEINPNVKVVISSGFSQEGIISELLKVGVMGFVQKPFLSDDFYKTIRGVLDSIA